MAKIIQEICPLVKRYKNTKMISIQGEEKRTSLTLSSQKGSSGNFVISASHRVRDFSKFSTWVGMRKEVLLNQDDALITQPISILKKSKSRVPGSARGKVVIASDFNAPLPESILAAFEQ